MKRDILTLSRLVAFFARHDINLTLFDVANEQDSQMLFDFLHSKDKLDGVVDIISGEEVPQTDNEKISMVADYFSYLSIEQAIYAAEIDKRKQHTIGLGIYREETPEELQKKMDEVKDIYLSNTYFETYISLMREGVPAQDLTISEALLANELIACQATIKAIYEMIGYIESDKPSFVKTVKEIIKYANFQSFALDIYNDCDKVCNEVMKKKSKE